jgi:hypothetical protein
MKKPIIFVDPGIVDLLTALNRIKGFETEESCDGHGRKPTWVLADCTTSESLESAAALLNLIVRKGNAIIERIPIPDSDVSINALSKEAILTSDPSERVDFSEAISAANRTMKIYINHQYHLYGLRIAFPIEYNGESTGVLIRRFVADLEQSGLLMEDCPIDFRPTPRWQPFTDFGEEEPIRVRGALEVKEVKGDDKRIYGGRIYGFLTDGKKRIFLWEQFFRSHALKSGDILEGDAYTFYFFPRSGSCIVRDALESGRTFDDYYFFYRIHTINGQDAESQKK